MDEGAILPLTFYCRNAQLCLAKAIESQKSGFVAEELQHLKTFTTLVSETIPSHPNFRNRQEDKHVLELHAYLSEAVKRIRELETSVARLQQQPSSLRPQTAAKPIQGRRHPKPPLASSVANRSTKTRTATEDHDRSLVHATNQDEDERSWNETGEEFNCQGCRNTGGYGDESSADSTLRHSHHRRKKPHDDHQQQQRRGKGLREWKGDFVRKAERIYGEGRKSRADIRPASAPRRLAQGSMLVERRPKESPGENNNLNEVDQVSGESDPTRLKMLEKPAILGSRLQSGMKEECEHFRRDMRILLEKANDSRNREAEVEGMLRSRLVDEMDLASSDTTSRIKHEQVHKASVGTPTKSPRINRLRGGHPQAVLETSDQTQEESNSKPGVANSSRKTASASRDTASGSSSGSSMTSGLPLSHYIQKLKKFSPDSQLGSGNLDFLNPVNNKDTGNSSGNVCANGTANLSANGIANGSGNGGLQHGDHHEKYKSCEETGPLRSSHEFSSLSHATTMLGEAVSAAIFLPANNLSTNMPTNSSSSPHGGGLLRPSPRLVDNRFGGGSGLNSALYTSLAHPAPLIGMSRLRPSQQESGSLAMFNSSSEQQDEDRVSSMVTPLNDLLLYPHFQNDTENDTSSEAKDDKLNGIQRVLGELKGSVKGLKIRLEVDGQGWRARVEGLEKELESLKEEADDEIIAAKHSLRNEMKVKLGDLMAEMERIRRQERDEVEGMVKERIEKQLKAQKETTTRSSIDMKDEIHRLWAEVDALVKNRQEMQGHVEHLTSVAQQAQEHANREHEMLKSENGYLRKLLQSLKNEGVQVKLETENFRMEREDLRLAVDKLRGEGTDTKLEIQSLKKMEKLIQAELEIIRTGFVKFQEEAQDMQRQNASVQVEGGRERKMIMERVESLSELYLGGLEEIRGDVSNVKHNCRDRIQEVEKLWNELRKQQPEKSNLASIQMLLNELDQFRSEIAEMVEIERGLVQQTLKRESERVQREVEDLLAGSKGEIVNVLKLDVQKWLQGTHEGVVLLTQSLKDDLDHLKSDLSRTQEGAEDLIQIASAAELQRDMAAAAAADASMSATKASNVLIEITTNINNEMKNTYQRIKQFQDMYEAEKDSVASAMYEARMMSQELQRDKDATFSVAQKAQQKHKDLQEYLERESSRLSTALMIVQKERDAASQAASEATSSATKARELLSDVVCAYDTEMANVRRLSSQLQEGIENERKHGFSEELELAIDGWKRALNSEISQAKEEADTMQKQLWRHGPFDPENPSLQVASMRFADQPDLKNYILKTEESICGLAAMVKELQDHKEFFSEEKKRRMMLKQQENERKEQHWNGEINQISQAVRVVEKRVLDVCGDYTEVRKRLKKCESTHLDLAHSVDDMSSTTTDLSKTVTTWLPRYEAAARVVNELSCKVERVEEKVEGFGCDEGLVQRISKIAETKVDGLKELVASGQAMEDIAQELRDLHERVQSCDRVHCQAVGEVASRVAQLERTVACCGPGQPCPGLSLKVEYTDAADSRKPGMGSLSQSVEALERKMEYMTEHNGALLGESATESRLLGLERRFEHVVSATFTNLRILDNKVDRVALGVQSAVEGAALAESKCGALGAELVKVFRMLTASNLTHSTSKQHQQQQKSIKNGPRSQSPPPPTQTLKINPEPEPEPEADENSCSQSPRSTRFTPSSFHRNNNRALFSPKRRSRIFISPRPRPVSGTKQRGGLRSMTRNGEADCMKTGSTTNSGSGKMTARDQQADASSTHSDPSDDDSTPPAPAAAAAAAPCKLHAPQDHNGNSRPQTAPADEHHHHHHDPLHPKAMRHGHYERSGRFGGGGGRRGGAAGNNSNNNHSSAIRVDAGRLHVNVSSHHHRSESSTRENMIAVQS